MRKVFLLVLVAFIAIPSFSQIKFGIKAGLSTTSLSMADIKSVSTGSTSYTVEALKEANYGFHGGGFMRVTLFGLYLQPELLFSSRTNEYTVIDLSDPTTELARKQSFNKLDIPVMVGFKIGPARINAGPAASLLINSPKDLINDPDLENNYSRMTIGYQAGLGVDILKFLTVDLRYEGSLKKYQNQIENLTGTKFNLDDRPNAFLLSVGLMF